MGYDETIEWLFSLRQFGIRPGLERVTYLLDYLDGHIARKRSTESPEGAILDAVLDRYIDLIVIGALTYSAADSALLVGLAALMGSALTPYVRAKTEAEGKGSIATIGDRGWRNRILIVGLLAGQPVWTLASTVPSDSGRVSLDSDVL